MEDVEAVEGFSVNIHAQNFSRPGLGCCGGCGGLPERYMVEIGFKIAVEDVKAVEGFSQKIHAQNLSRPGCGCCGGCGGCGGLPERYMVEI